LEAKPSTLAREWGKKKAAERRDSLYTDSHWSVYRYASLLDQKKELTHTIRIACGNELRDPLRESYSALTKIRPLVTIHLPFHLCHHLLLSLIRSSHERALLWESNKTRFIAGAPRSKILTLHTDR